MLNTRPFRSQHVFFSNFFSLVCLSFCPSTGGPQHTGTLSPAPDMFKFVHYESCMLASGRLAPYLECYLVDVFGWHNVTGKISDCVSHYVMKM